MDISTASLTDLVSFGEGLLTEDSWTNLVDTPVSIYAEIEKLKQLPINETNIADDSYTLPLLAEEMHLTGRSSIMHNGGYSIFAPPEPSLSSEPKQNFFPIGFNSDAGSNENNPGSVLSLVNDGPVSAPNLPPPPSAGPNETVVGLMPPQVFGDILRKAAQVNQINADGSPYGYKANPNYAAILDTSYLGFRPYKDRPILSGLTGTPNLYNALPNELKYKYIPDETYVPKEGDNMVLNPKYVAGGTESKYMPDPLYIGQEWNPKNPQYVATKETKAAQLAHWGVRTAAHSAATFAMTTAGAAYGGSVGAPLGPIGVAVGAAIGFLGGLAVDFLGEEIFDWW